MCTYILQLHEEENFKWKHCQGKKHREENENKPKETVYGSGSRPVA